MDFNKWKEKYENSIINEIFFKKDNNDEIIRIYIEYLEKDKINAKEIENYFNNLNKIKGKSSGIIVILGKLTPQAKQEILEFNSKKQIECFNISELMANITKHPYVPQHFLLDQKEKKYY